MSPGIAWDCVTTLWVFDPSEKLIIIILGCFIEVSFPGVSRVKNLPAVKKTPVQSLGWGDPLEKEMATHSSLVAWEIPWTEEPGWLLPIGSQRVRYNWAAKQPQQSTTFYQDAKAHYLLYLAKTGPEIFCCAHMASNLWGLEADSLRVQASSLRARLWAGSPAAKTVASWCA